VGGLLLPGLALMLAGCAQPPVLGLPPPVTAWPMTLPPPAKAPPAPDLPVPPLTMPDALVDDPEAQRFVVLGALKQGGLVPPEDAEARRDANLGALLPYSEMPPAAGLDTPFDPAPLVERLAGLARTPEPAPPAVAAERGVILDYLLPRLPRGRARPAREEPQALELGRKRVGMLYTLGLVGEGERDQELGAIGRAEQALADRPAPPVAAPPAPAPKKARPARSRPAADPTVSRPGDVPGGAIPAGGTGPLGVHLLSMASPAMTDKAVEALKKEYPDLAPLQFKAVKTVIPDLGTTWRLLGGPLPKDQAEALCRALRGKGQSCVVSSFGDAPAQ